MNMAIALLGAECVKKVKHNSISVEVHVQQI
jgi:hypothetical protein